jgi:hypothetical protein
MVFAYTKNKVTNIRQEQASATSGPYYNIDVVWEGDNIRTVTHRIGADTFCTKLFSYDMSKSNPMVHHNYLYFGDGDSDYGGYKLPYYFSKNIMTKVEAKCGSSESSIYSYIFNGDGLLERFINNSDTLWAYEYNCQ